MEPSTVIKGVAPGPTHPQRGIRIIAALLVYVSFRVLYSEVTGDGFTDSWVTSLRSDVVLAVFKLATVCVGIVVAVGLFSAKRWAFWSYIIWMPLYVGTALVADSRVEQVAWKVALGGAIVLILPVFGAAYLYKKTIVRR